MKTPSAISLFERMAPSLLPRHANWSAAGALNTARDAERLAVQAAQWSLATLRPVQLASLEELVR